jgi:hypothetical protein
LANRILADHLVGVGTDVFEAGFTKELGSL